MAPPELPEWERLLSAERHLQALVPGSVLVGGTAAALHAGHRRSLDGDHVLEDLRPRFEDVLATLEAAAGWQTARVQRPVTILGRLDGVMTGIRQLRRTRPLETELISGLRVPTLAEMARVKAWLLATRHTVRDYLDTVVPARAPGRRGRARRPSHPFDEIYRQEAGRRPSSRWSSASRPRLRPTRPRSTWAATRASWPPGTTGVTSPARGRHWAGVLASGLLGGSAR